MTEDERVHISKFLSLVLRHRPEQIGLTLDEAGWAEVDALVDAARENGVDLDRRRLREVVDASEKNRFAFSPDRTRIRATYGHSIPVDLALEPRQPPEYLYHGTARRFLPSIREEGLRSRSRQFVHLSRDREEALAVGRRHGKPVVLQIRAASLAKEGQPFYRSNDLIWLTGPVPPRYVEELV